MTDYIDKEKLLKAFDETNPICIYNSIICGEFDVEISPSEGYMLVSIEDYNNKSKLLKEKDAEIVYLNELLRDEYIRWRVSNRKPVFINGQLMKN